MRTFDRLGVHVEQCQSCKGIFLDYGELEQIVTAEQQYNEDPPPLEYGAGGPAQAPTQGRGRPDSPAPYRGRSDSPSPYGGRKDSPGPFGGGLGGLGGGRRDSPRPGGKKRKKSMFEQLFD